MKKLLFVLVLVFAIDLVCAQENPNILLIIADDMGADVMPGYDLGTNLPLTPNLDDLRQSGITFTNVWASPVCSASRATIMTGKHGVKNGVPSVPGILSTEHTSIFKQLKQQSNNEYKTALVGKWHLGKNNDYDHPNDHGVDEFMGVMGSGVTDYYKWNKVENQSMDTCYEYATSYFTNHAIDWINKQSNPWMMWLAHVSPHGPYHYPPEGTYTKGKEGTKTMKQYLSMIENLDYEIGRLLTSIPDDVLENTLVIFVGDNGTPSNVIQAYNKGKGSLYQGGIHVPMILSGKGVLRENEIESAHVNVCDLFATIAHFSNDSISETGGLYNSLSFKHVLSGEEGFTREYNYMELGRKSGFPNDAFTVRDEQYKMIQFIDSIQEFYDLINDPFENNNLLLGDISADQLDILNDLEHEANTIRSDWSCRDGIKNGNETGIDCGALCGDCLSILLSDKLSTIEVFIYPNPFDHQLSVEFIGQIASHKIQLVNIVGQLVEEISLTQDKRVNISTNDYDPGLYFITLLNQDGKRVHTSKLIKN